MTAYMDSPGSRVQSMLGFSEVLCSVKVMSCQITYLYVKIYKCVCVWGNFLIEMRKSLDKHFEELS